MRKLGLFALAAVGAAAIGMGAAEVQSRWSPKEPVDENATTTSAASAEKSSLMVEEMIGAIRQPRDEIVDDIRADCKYRFPGPNDWSVRDACVERQRALFDQIRNIFDTTSDRLAVATVVYCMDENRSLNGFDWQDVSWCYERNLVAISKAS